MRHAYKNLVQMSINIYVHDSLVVLFKNTQKASMIEYNFSGYKQSQITKSISSYIVQNEPLIPF